MFSHQFGHNFMLMSSDRFVIESNLTYFRTEGKLIFLRNLLRNLDSRFPSSHVDKHIEALLRIEYAYTDIFMK